MPSLLKFDEFNFINENSTRKKWEDLESRIRAQVPEIGGETWRGSSSWTEASIDNPEGALGRILGGIGIGLSKAGKAIFGAIGDKFNSGSKGEEEAFSRWGESIQSSGKNKQKDYEDFYTKSIHSGKETFGPDFDVEKPRTREQRRYRDYLRRSRSYFDID